MRILVACEYSAIVRDAFRARGHDAYSCDLLPCEGDPRFHFQCNVLDILDLGWDMMIGHPVCTYLTLAGVRHLHSIPSKNGKLPKVHGAERWAAMRDGAEFFNRLKEANIPKIAVENPTPHGYATALIGEYSQRVQPWYFGDPFFKGICLWLKNLPHLRPTDMLTPPAKGTPEHKMWSAVHRASPGAGRAKERSKFFPGIAAAMAEQWGTPVADLL